MRKNEKYCEIFTYGAFEPLFETEEKILAYRRSLNGRDVIVAANFGMERKCLSNQLLSDKRVLLSNARVTLENDTLQLLPSQVVVLA